MQDIKPDKIKIEISKVISVRQLGELSNVDPSLIVQKLFQSGISATINESIDFDTAVLIGDELGIEVKEKKKQEKKERLVSKNAKLRPPVVAVMGHVDHGKTKLLDAIRNTNVIATESGGITQHIGAYQIEPKFEGQKRVITFLDTPGHQAFSALRAHGANLTDIIILVVAANEGVREQTIEAISHAKAAQVPIIIAINKIDLPDADADKVKRELSKRGLLTEDWGGDIPVVEVSAKTGKNIENILEMILLVADLNEFKAVPDGPAYGTVIESHMEVGVGPVATLLIEEGQLNTGNFIVIGKTYGKIRFIKNWQGEKIEKAGPSTPVKIGGIRKIPEFGDYFKVFEDEKTAKKMLEVVGSMGITRSKNDSDIDKEKFNIILKADVVGSLDAIGSSVKDICTDKVKINIISQGVGDITESDINLARSSRGLIYAFKSNVPSQVQTIASREKIEINNFETIYELIDHLTANLEGRIAPKISEILEGKLYVMKVFFQTKESAIIGGKVEDGKISKKLKVYLELEDKKRHIGFVTSTKIGPSEVEDIKKGDECGVKISKTDKSSDIKLKDGQTISFYKVVKEIIKLT